MSRTGKPQNDRKSRFGTRSILNRRFRLVDNAYVFAFLTVVIWGLATPVTKATVANVPPMTFLTLRLWIMSLILIGPAIEYIRKQRLGGRRLLRILGAAMIGNVLTLILYFEGIAHTSSTEVAIITSVYPLTVCIFGSYVLHELLSKRQKQGLLIAFIGILLIILEPILLRVSSIDGGEIALWGNLLILLAVLADASYSIYTKKYISPDRVITPFMLISISFVFAAMVITPLGVGEQYKLYRTKYNLGVDNTTNMRVYDRIYDDSRKIGINENVTEEVAIANTTQSHGDNTYQSFVRYATGNMRRYLSPPSIYGILYMALFSGILAYTFYNKALESIEASKLAVFYYLQPLVAVPVSLVLLGDTISYIFVAGAGLIIFGVFLVEKHR